MATQDEITRQLVVTQIANTQCGIDISAVHELILMQEITPVPKSPRNMLGMINVRGVLLPVVDLRACLGFPPAPITSDTRIVLVSCAEKKIGLVVDSVAEVIALPNEAFQSMDGSEAESPYLRSVVRLEDRLILDIDHERVVQDGLETVPAGLSPLLEALEASIEDGADKPVRLVEEEEPDMIDETTTTESDEPTAEDDADEGGLNVELLESSFALLAPQGEQLVARFYERLFETAPAVRSLFPDDMTDQKKALLGALGTVVSTLRTPEKLTAHLQELGERHIGYGAVAAHYDVVAEVLVATMAEFAGDVWNDELQTAWTAALTAVKDIMLSVTDKAEEAAA